MLLIILILIFTFLSQITHAKNQQNKTINIEIRLYDELIEEDEKYMQIFSSDKLKEKLEFCNIKDEEIVFVDDNNILGPWDGTQKNPYQYIQDGINAVKENGKVYVFNGSYIENIYINNSIKLEGENRNNTIINGDGNSNTISINNNLIRISKFTIKNGQKGIYLNNSDYVNISKNIIKGNRDGIWAHKTNNSYFNDNLIENCNGSGIYLFNSNHQILINNTIIDCYNGVYLEESSNNNILNNQIIKNEKGIFCSYAPNNQIIHNKFFLNKENAKFSKFCHKDFILPNKWNNNYWDDWIGFGVKVIPGIMYIPNKNLIGLFIPWIELDLNPARELYQIT